MPHYCHDCRLERDAATVGRSPCPDCGSTRVDATAYAEPAYATVTVHPATVVTASTGQKHAQGSAVVSARPVTEATGYKVVEGEQAPEVTDALVVQGFGLWWHLLTASPPTWMAQVFDAAGDPLATVVGDNPVQMFVDLAEWLLPHHPG
jgi:hypothetical protein